MGDGEGGSRGHVLPLALFPRLSSHIWPPAAFISRSLTLHGSRSKTRPPTHPAWAPRRSPRTTHAESQQENVEQKLDTLHSSFHRHGCWAWGRGERQELEQVGQAEGPPHPQLPAGLRSLPCAAPIAALPPRNPRSDPRLPALPARRPDWGAPRSGASGSRDAQRARPDFR